MVRSSRPWPAADPGRTAVAKPPRTSTCTARRRDCMATPKRIRMVKGSPSQVHEVLMLLEAERTQSRVTGATESTTAGITVILTINRHGRIVSTSRLLVSQDPRAKKIPAVDEDRGGDEKRALHRA